MGGHTFKLFDTTGAPRGLSIGQGNTLVSLSFWDHAIHEGRLWYIQGFKRVNAAAEKTYFYLRLPQLVGVNPFDVHMRWIVSANSECEMKIFLAPTPTDWGTRMMVGNRNANFASSPYYARVYQDGAFSDLGLQLWEDIIGSGKKNEAGDQALGQFILPSPYSYLMEVTKVAQSAGWISWQFGWTEHFETIPIVINSTTTTTTTTTT